MVCAVVPPVIASGPINRGVRVLNSQGLSTGIFWGAHLHYTTTPVATRTRTVSLYEPISTVGMVPGPAWFLVGQGGSNKKGDTLVQERDVSDEPSDTMTN